MRLTVAVLVYLGLAVALLEVGAGLAFLTWARRRARVIREDAEARALLVEAEALTRAGRLVQTAERVALLLERPGPGP